MKKLMEFICNNWNWRICWYNFTEFIACLREEDDRGSEADETDEYTGEDDDLTENEDRTDEESDINSSRGTMAASKQPRETILVTSTDSNIPTVVTSTVGDTAESRVWILTPARISRGNWTVDLMLRFHLKQYNVLTTNNLWRQNINWIYQAEFDKPLHKNKDKLQSKDQEKKHDAC